MKILHTADWHLGASFGTEKRTEEFQQTLNWLTDKIREEKIEAVLIAGDIFDTGIPPNSAVEQYYNFLLDAHEAGVRHIIIVAGNHDSASFLDAPRSILKKLNIFVAGKADPGYDSLIIPLAEADGTVSAVVCAVPFLRDRDVRQAVSGESVAQQQDRRHEGILAYYRNITKRAKELYPGLPVIAMGHFYANGSQVSPDTVVGTLSQVEVNQLPAEIDYLALGHLHIPQAVGGRENCRYSGSLLRMSFSEIKPGSESRKSVLVLDTANLSAPPKEIPVEPFQRIEVISGTVDELERKIRDFTAKKISVWIDAVNTGKFQPGLNSLVASWCENSPVRLIRCTSTEEDPAVQVRRQENAKPLSELTPEAVFRDLLEKQGFPEEQRKIWMEAFLEAVRDIEEADVNA